MERPDKKTISKNIFKEVYPEKYKDITSRSLVPDPEGRIAKNGQKYVGYFYSCDYCGDVTWHNRNNIFQDYGRDGKIRCAKCAKRKTVETLGVEGRKAASRKAMETLGVEGRKAASRKAMDTMGSDGLSNRAKKTIESLGPDGLSARRKKQLENQRISGYFESESFHESRVRGQATREANGTDFKEYEIRDIIKRFPGGYHAPAGTVHSDLPGEGWIGMEMDIYYPSVKMCIELDTPDHQKRYKDYHRKKREYLQNHGITVLNIPVNRPNYGPDGVYNHKHRVDGTMYDLIDVFLQGKLPRELEILWEDPWYVNG